MHRAESVLLIAFAVAGSSIPAGATNQVQANIHPGTTSQVEVKRQGYVSPDGKRRAIVIGFGRQGQAANESRIEVRTVRGKLLAQASYVSTDAEHGKGVVQAAWTPDSQFFVWSTESSGGHQPWHWPTYFFSRRSNKILSLDDFVGAVTSSNFAIKVPDVVQGRRLQGQNIQGVPFTVKLSHLHPGR